MEARLADPIQFTNDPNVMYAIDYATNGVLDASIPVRSNDGGNTWNHLPDPTTNETYYMQADFDNVDRLIVTNYNTMFISLDGGQSWAAKYTTPSNDDGLHIGGAFFDGSNIYVGTNQGLLVSNNGGVTFTLQALTGFEAGEDIVSFSGAKEGGVTRLFAVAQTEQIWAGHQAWDYYSFSNVYRMDVGSTDWVSVKSNLPANSKPYFVDMAANGHRYAVHRRQHRKWLAVDLQEYQCRQRLVGRLSI